MRIALDSNILVYALDTSDPSRHALAVNVVERAMLGECVLCAQVLGEFLAVIRRRFPAGLSQALAQAERWANLCPPVPTASEHMLAAGAMVLTHGFQFWDAVIWQVAASRQVTCLLSEDMQDGFSLGGLAVLNPFLPANRAKLDIALSPGG